MDTPDPGPDEEMTMLPTVLPVFPIGGAVLLPRGVMPLNIFEPRYLAMVRDAMAGSNLIGMIQPRLTMDDDADAGGRPGLFDVGCAGRITEFRETGDGRMIIALTGVARFAVARELDVTTPYRQVMPDFDAFADDEGEPRPLAPAARSALETTLRSYLDTQGLSADWTAVAEADDDSLVTTLSAVCPFDPVERQALLEARDLPARAATLNALMTFAQGAGGSDGNLLQ
ncbi:LON peptidase substrate-binding domain-containing protein [Polymorphobacter sp. PAMC 29334]|uniref:LON peptidase substrate-binding domain-containing protein n=1 Tax=Polymorphobacter sp. PAMC 29334 TaxID=2862331 RepID=UPI001D0201E4|nr:LON peptidase substrate-binding domain-containing protein [Polymorphobacter sp. PAMC 29334]